jgi:signal transduction histidine kinase
MNTRVLDKLKNISPWHFIWISIVASELITLILSDLQGRLWWGGVSSETLIIGAVDSLVVPLIVATVVVYSVKQIAELSKANDLLQAANQNLRSIDKMKTDFMTVVSHELRTPLTTIKAFLELIDMKPGMPEQQRAKLMGTINVETDRLMRLIGDLLDLARIEAGSMKWRSEELSIEEVIQSSLSGIGPLFENKGLRLTTAINSPLSRFRGDRDRLVQVVTNILFNAVKFTPAGGAVHVAAREESAPDSQIVVEISDTGIGIPAEDLELIFEKFQRAGDQLTSAIEGTGLGLSIARQIVEYHGGRIWAASTRGKGSMFTFTLPLSEKKGQPVQIEG